MEYNGLIKQLNSVLEVVNSAPLPREDIVSVRRKKVLQLNNSGCTQVDMSHHLKCSLRANVEYGLRKWIDYFSKINPMAAGQDLGGDPIDAMVESGRAVIGTPADAILQLERLEKQTGGFGCFLHLAANWADFEATKKSYELFARHVLPRFHRANEARDASLQWATDNSEEFIGAAMKAVMEMFQKHHNETAEPAEVGSGESTGSRSEES